MIPCEPSAFFHLRCVLYDRALPMWKAAIRVNDWPGCRDGYGSLRWHSFPTRGLSGLVGSISNVTSEATAVPWLMMTNRKSPFPTLTNSAVTCAWSCVCSFFSRSWICFFASAAVIASDSSCFTWTLRARNSDRADIMSATMPINELMSSYGVIIFFISRRNLSFYGHYSIVPNSGIEYHTLKS